MAEATVVFADLTGSTRVFEKLGNAEAALTVTRLTQWIAKVCTKHGAHLIKSLGDGVLAAFADNGSAVNAGIELQRAHSRLTQTLPGDLQMPLQMGMARGEVIVEEGDCYGDAVNLASRLSDLSGPGQILVASQVTGQLGTDSDVRFRVLGPLDIRGRAEPCLVSRIEWEHEHASQSTVPADLARIRNPGSSGGSLTLTSPAQSNAFPLNQLPIFIGRDPLAQVVIADPHVSRFHVRMDWSGGICKLEDVSSYGTWVRFAGGDTIIALRRQDCALHDQGEIALGAPFEDTGVPILRFIIAA